MKLSKKKFFIIGCILIIVIFIIGIFYIVSNKNNSILTEDVLYSTRYSFGMGSIGVKIYRNGDVYDDLEIEDPNHKPNYKFVKTLSSEELEVIVNLLENDSNNKEINDYVIKLVYGVEEFDNFGRPSLIQKNKKSP